MNMNQAYPTLEDFSAAMAVKIGAIEIIKQPLYDYQLYPTAGQGLMQFFQFPQGQGLSASPGNANAVKALSDTNMIQGGTLPAPQAYWCDSLEVDFQPGSVATANTFTLVAPTASVAAAAATVQAGANDAETIYNSGALSFVIGTKNYYQEAPLYRFPPRSQFALDVSMSSNSATATEMAKEKFAVLGRKVILDPGIGIMTSMNFQVNLIWPAVVATPSGFNGRVGVIIDGYQFRAVQ